MLRSNRSRTTRTNATSKGEGRYRKISDINSGSFGFVQLSEDRVTGELYAIKHIERGPKIDKHVLYEIMNHRNLLHHHVIQFKEVYLTARHLCIVMEYAPGGDMLEFVKKKNGLNEGEARWFFQQLIVGLDYCHQMGVASRDIKLENTLLDSGPWPLLKICDFGYSKHEQFNSKPGSRVGTPAYLAPEVILNKRGQTYDGKKADIWSCGVFLYVMIFGAYPFDNPEERRRNLPDKLQRMISRIVDSPFALPAFPVLSDDLKDLFNKIMVKSPNERITVEGIMRHPWFQTNLPEGAMDMNKKLQKQKSGIQSEDDIAMIVQEAKIPFMDEELGYDYIDRALAQQGDE